MEQLTLVSFDLTKLEGLTWIKEIGGHRLSLFAVHIFPLIILRHFYFLFSPFFSVYGPFNCVIDIWSS